MIYSDIQRLIYYSVSNKLIDKEDEIVVRNMLMDALGLHDWQDEPFCDDISSIESILSPLVDFACDSGVIEDTVANRDLFDTKLMGIVTPMPRDIIREFNARLSPSPAAAMDWYYDISKKTDYVRAERISKDLKWKYDSAYGTLDITINRSKPEKDPRDIARAGASESASYPKCQLCADNMGFAGDLSRPARQNLRPVPVRLNGGRWYLQYSPYGYYNEHCIVFNERHIPMKIDASVFDKLFDFVVMFPHYFIGSNADLPIVGGSILSHEHFQGGNYTFAMARAASEYVFDLSGYSGVEASVIKWPMSVIRLRGADRKELAAACGKVLSGWRSYCDPLVGIHAYTGDISHNTITPIARTKDGVLECDLVLRNNITSPDRPLGVFHPNPTLHHIKKENIGLIEVMGLAVLPARLAGELEAVRRVLLEGGSLVDDPVTKPHAEWADELVSRHPDLSADNADRILRDEVGAVFEQVLSDAGVFKRDGSGRAAFERFIGTLV